MNIASSFYSILSHVPVVLFASSSTAVRARGRVLTGPNTLERKWSLLRMRVLSRDRSRCRGCDTKGDEVTLRIRPIRPDASDLDGLVALCVKCDELASDRKLEGIGIPEFLRHLWRHIHHRDEAGQIIENDRDPIDAVRTRDELTVPLNASGDGSWFDGILLGPTLNEVAERQVSGAMTAEAQVL